MNGVMEAMIAQPSNTFPILITAVNLKDVKKAYREATTPDVRLMLRNIFPMVDFEEPWDTVKTVEDALAQLGEFHHLAVEYNGCIPEWKKDGKRAEIIRIVLNRYRPKTHDVFGNEIRYSPTFKITEYIDRNTLRMKWVGYEARIVGRNEKYLTTEEEMDKDELRSADLAKYCGRHFGEIFAKADNQGYTVVFEKKD